MGETLLGQPEEHSGTIFSQKAFEECKEVILDEATAGFIRRNPKLTVRLLKLRGIASLDGEKQKIVLRTEYELWQHLKELEDTNDPLAQRITEDLAWWERCGYPPLASDFTYDDVQAVKSIRDESDFAHVIFDIIPGKDRRLPIIPMTPIGKTVNVSPDYL